MSGSTPISAKLRSPASHDEFVEVNVPNVLMQKLSASRSSTKIFELQYVVCGQPPVVNNIGYHERSSKVEDNWKGLEDACGIFRGLKRPMNNVGVAEKIYAYVLAPNYTYEYIPNMVCCAKRDEAPNNAVFVVYVQFDADFSRGTVLYWEWVKANGGLPEDKQDRYDEEIWIDG